MHQCSLQFANFEGLDTGYCIASSGHSCFVLELIAGRVEVTSTSNNGAQMHTSVSDIIRPDHNSSRRQLTANHCYKTDSAIVNVCHCMIVKHNKHNLG